MLESCYSCKLVVGARLIYTYNKNFKCYSVCCDSVSLLFIIHLNLQHIAKVIVQNPFRPVWDCFIECKGDIVTPGSADLYPSIYLS